MIRRLGRRKFKVFAMDIESHNDPISIEKRETSCWLGCFIDENSKMDDPRSYFRTMDEFLDRLSEESTRPKRRTASESVKCFNVCVYIYNLSFEWSFLLPVMLKRGFVCKECIGKEDEYVFTSVSTKSVSSVWQVEMKFGRKQGTVYLRDLAKIYGGGLDNVAKAFNLPTQKGEIDYRKNRLAPDYVPTKEEKEYCFKDTRIIIDILEKMADDKAFWKSISMASYSTSLMIKKGWPRSYRPYLEFRKQYPEIPEADEEAKFLRESVAGGITYACERYQFKNIKGKIGHIDLHQAHPSSLYLNWFPKGRGTYFKGEPPIGRISCCRIKFSYSDVKLHSVIKLIGLPFVDGIELTLWDFEIRLLYDCYVNAEVEYIDGYAYEMAPLPWKSYYKENYLKRKKAKAEHDAFFALYYKLLNNSSYGKLLERLHAVYYANTVDENGIITSVEIPPEQQRPCAKYTYIPVGSCCPAYTRVTLVSAALKLGWKNVLYFDTDSIFFLMNEESMEGVKKLDFEDHLGGWGWEEDDIAEAQFTAPKRYKTRREGHEDATVKAGGINFSEYLQRTKEASIRYLMEEKGMSLREAVASIPLSYEEVNIVSSKWKVQRAFRCKGGTIIDFQEKEIKIPDKYKDIYDKNK